ncbi:uncharacterized protein LOC142982667 isoform X2 [Anticarsia gemmatalis]|uniref:uncharacterized protein LOC142982667 isoform X2 n=1 Tax=Anticarsia gemmatalis TaxID=129554 RepID=UPI003F757C78
MRYSLYLTLYLLAIVTKGDEYAGQNLTVKQISDKFIETLNSKPEYGRIKELKAKINKINKYIINNDLFSDLLTNITSETDLNETNFYESLIEKDHFQFLSANDSDNLYLKLKSKMNRDDILKILADKAEEGRLRKSARRMMKNPIAKREDEEKINDVVDKMIGELPNDDHKKVANESIYWDPQGELEDLKEYHDRKRDGRRIFRGERTTIRYYPFMASIHVMGRFWCGGVLYWNDMVITSASCLQLMHNNRFFRENPRVLQVRVGSNHSRVGGEKIDVLEVYFHPSYEPKTLRNNLAVIRLRRRLTFTYHRIPKIIAISDLPNSVPATAEVLVLGWGVTKMSQKFQFEPIFLQRKFIPVYPNTFCKEVYGNMFCAGTFTTGEGACDHDAGGPAILSGRLVGIISFGPALCGYPNAPTVFTLVGAYSDWIESINESMPAYYTGKGRTTTTTKADLNQFFLTWKPADQAYREAQATKVLSPLIVHATTTSSTVQDTPEPAPILPTEETTRATEATTSAPVRFRDGLDSDWSIEDKK